VIIRPKTTGAPAPKIEPSQTLLESYQPAICWILSGNPSNWKVALRRNIWGLKPKHRSLWQQVKEGDPVFLYATRPISGLIGFGKTTRIMEEDRPFWPDEVESGEVKYPYRIEFKPMRILDELNWKARRIPIGHLGLIYFKAINPIVDKELMEKLLHEVTNRNKIA